MAWKNWYKKVTKKICRTKFGIEENRRTRNLLNGNKIEELYCVLLSGAEIKRSKRKSWKRLLFSSLNGLVMAEKENIQIISFYRNLVASLASRVSFSSTSAMFRCEKRTTKINKQWNASFLSSFSFLFFPLFASTKRKQTKNVLKIVMFSIVWWNISCDCLTVQCISSACVAFYMMFFLCVCNSCEQDTETTNRQLKW